MKYEISLNGHKYVVEVDLCEPISMQEFSTYAPAAPAVVAAAPEVPAASNTAASAPVTGAGNAITAPMPGNILKVNVSAGDKVKEGTVLVILEAMKMENEILAPKDGTVTQVIVSKGSNVETGAVLVVLN